MLKHKYHGILLEIGIVPVGDGKMEHGWQRSIPVEYLSLQYLSMADQKGHLPLRKRVGTLRVHLHQTVEQMSRRNLCEVIIPTSLAL